jgi:hypothetical protein
MVPPQMRVSHRFGAALAASRGNDNRDRDVEIVVHGHGAVYDARPGSALNSFRLEEEHNVLDGTRMSDR